MSVLITRYGLGGYDPAKPNGNAAVWFDTDTRTAYAVTNGVTSSRPFNDSENAVADALVRRGHISEQNGIIRQSLLDGIATLEDAEQQCAADRDGALTRQSQASAVAAAQTARAATIRSIPAPSNAQIKEELALIREDIATVANALAEVYGWRALLDSGLSLSYQSTIGLARIEIDGITA